MSKNSANLDFLRAFAVISVFAAHVFQMLGIGRIGLISNTSLAQTGVMIFFVHTSLVLMFSMERLALRGFDLFAVFYIRRAFRIYPLSILVVLSCILLSIPAFPTREYSWLGWYHVLSNFALAQNLTYSPSVLGPLWSLPFEVQMYVLLPVLYLAVKRYSSPWFPIGLWVLSIVAALIQAQTIGRFSLAQYAPCFLGGVIAFVQLRTQRQHLPFIGWPLVIVSCFAIRELGFAGGWLACLLLGVSAPHFRELKSKVLMRSASLIARYSYGIYLSHVIVLWTAFVVFQSASLPVRILLGGVLATILPVAMYHFIEKPMIGIGVQIADRFRNRRNFATPAAETAEVNSNLANYFRGKVVRAFRAGWSQMFSWLAGC